MNEIPVGLELPSGVVLEIPELVPARMLNEYTYCPRLAYLMWVQGEFVDSADTVDGRYQHRRVDRPSGDVPAPEDIGDETIHARSVMMSAPGIGLIARMDLLELEEDGHATPVDYKRGKAPDLEERAWEPERVQLCAQALILRENGYTCEEGILYFVGSKRRVPIRIDDALVRKTLDRLAQMRATAAAGKIPPPLVNSPKCPRCSLVGICLPDEVNLLASDQAPTRRNGGYLAELRRLVPTEADALPMYVQAQGATITKDGDLLQIREKGRVVQEARLMEVSQVAVYGNVQVTAQTVNDLCRRGIPITHFSYGGWFHGITHGMSHKNVELRRKQFAAAEDQARSLQLARAFVSGKIRNCRTFLRRNHPSSPQDTLEELTRLAESAERVSSAESLLGIEGTAARLYFSRFGEMFRHPPDEDPPFFDFLSRNRRPPRDPVNALLSFVYTLLIKDMTVTLLSVGFDPYLGFYHRPRYGRPALALDLVEEFRPLLADSVVLGLINTREIQSTDFISCAGAVAMTDNGRKKVIGAYERRLETLVTHPIFRYALSYRRVLEVQVRLIGRYLAGEIADYPAFRTR